MMTSVARCTNDSSGRPVIPMPKGSSPHQGKDVTMRRHAMPLQLAAIALLFSPHVTAQTLGLPLSYRGVMRGFGGGIDVSGDKAGVRTFAGTVVVALGHIMVDSQKFPFSIRAERSASSSVSAARQEG